MGICSTIYGDKICRGCFRAYQEIIDWNTYADTQKLAILDELAKQMLSVLQDKLEVSDPLLLQNKCAQLNVKIRLSWDPLTWAHALMREGIDRIQDLKKYGIIVKPAYANLRLPKLIELIDDEIYANS